MRTHKARGAGAPAASLLGLRGAGAGGRVAARLREVLIDERRRRTSEAVPAQHAQRLVLYRQSAHLIPAFAADLPLAGCSGALA